MGGGLEICSPDGPGAVDSGGAGESVEDGVDVESTVGNDAAIFAHFAALIFSALAKASLLFFNFMSPTVGDTISPVESSRSLRLTSIAISLTIFHT